MCLGLLGELTAIGALFKDFVGAEAHNLRGQQMPSPRPWKMIRYSHSTVRNPS